MPFFLAPMVVFACQVPADEPPGNGENEPVLEDPVVEVDLLVIGGGAAGSAAAWEGSLRGAEVLVLEMGALSGGGGRYAANLFAVDTALQAEHGISDSVEEALEEWESFTGGDGSDPRVMRFVEESAATLNWLGEESGVEYGALGLDVGAGSVMRMHQLLTTESFPSTIFVEALGEQVWHETRADALVVDQGQVIGVRFTDLVSGETGWVAASDTVVATGGFARNLERLLQDRPELEDQRLLVETHTGMQGLGHEMLEAVDSAWQNQGHYGLYAHSIPDYRDPGGVESLFFPGLFSSLVVDLRGERVANEQAAQGFQMSRILLDAPEGRLFALLDRFTVELGSFRIPAYNWQDEGVGEEIPSSVVLDEGGITRFESLEALAAALGIEEETLVATVARYEELVLEQEDEDFGKDPAFLKLFVDEVYYVMELTLGAAKAYGGVDISDNWQVLDSTGEAVGGLYAAGEVVGMLGTPGVGDGFSGSVTACYYGGRQAAIAALEE